LGRPLLLVSRIFDQSVFIGQQYVLFRLIIMCLAIPAKVMSLDGDKAKVDFGEKVLREVNVTLVDAKVGDYVLIHAGYAIQLIEEKEALETLQLWKDLLVKGE
jgi:hydrogenase expression/formation protein HypC